MFYIHVSFIVYIWASSHDDWDLSIVEEANWKFGMTTSTTGYAICVLFFVRHNKIENNFYTFI